MRLDSSDLKLVRQRIKAAEAYSDSKLVKERRIDRMRQWFKGDHYNPSQPLSKINESDRVVVNYSLINVLVKVAQLSFGIPNFRVIPKDRSADTTLDRQVLNWTWRSIRAKLATKTALFDCKICGTGLCGTNWRVETFTSIYTGGDKPEEAADNAVVYDGPEVRRIKPEWGLFDPDHPDDWHKGWYAGEQWQVPLVQMKRSPRYEHIADKLKGETIPDYLGQAKNAGTQENWYGLDERDEKLNRVQGYTIYCRDLGVVVDWSPEVPDEPLWVGDAEFYPQDPMGRPYYPYALLQNIPLMDSHYGLSDIEVTETQQAEIDIARSLLALVRRQNNGQMMALEGILDETALEQIQSGVENAIIKIKGQPGMKLSDIIGMMPRDTVQQEAYTTLEAARSDMSELSRASAYARGAAVPGIKYATEARQIEAGTQGLQSEERATFEDFNGELGEQVHSLLARWTTDMRQVPEQPGQAPQEWTGKTLTPGVECIVEPGSMDPPDQAFEEQKWAQRLQLIVPLMAAGINPRPLIEAYLRAFDFPQVEEVLGNFPQVPQPMPGAGPPGAPGAGGAGMPEAGMGGEGGEGAPNLPPEILAALAGGGQ